MATAQAANTQYVNAGGITLAYRHIGRLSSSVPLVMLMHFRGNMDFWDPALVNRLAEARPIILLDNAGTGRSGGEVPLTIQGWADNVILLIQALNIHTIDLLGFSMGGFTAQMVALNAPYLVRKLILAGTRPSQGPNIVNGDPGPLRRLATATTSSEVESAFAETFFTPTDAGKAAARASWRRINERTEDRNGILGRLDTKRQLEAAKDWSIANPRNSFDRLGELKMPVFVANGDQDALIPSASGPRSLGVIEIEDIEMSDAVDSDVSEIDGVNKRKRTTPSPQKARKQRASQNRADLSSTEAQSPSEHIAVKRRTRKQSLKAREAQKLQEELDEHSHGTQRAQGDQDQDIMSLLREMNRNTAEMNKRMAQMEKSNAEKEEAYKGQIARLEEMVQAMQVDLARTMAGSFGSRSFASVASSGVPLSRTNSRVSFDVSPPRDSPLHTPSRSSTTTSQRSALRDPSKDPIGNGSRITMDLKLLNEEDTAELDTPPKIRDRLEKGLQSIEGLQDIKLKDFKMWHTNDSVKIIRFVVSKEEEKLIRQYSHEWVPAYLR
ncbi:hypothetical protein B0A49_11269, partial [Cryomyces minteri]